MEPVSRNAHGVLVGVICGWHRSRGLKVALRQAQQVSSLNRRPHDPVFGDDGGEIAIRESDRKAGFWRAVMPSGATASLRIPDPHFLGVAFFDLIRSPWAGKVNGGRWAVPNEGTPFLVGCYRSGYVPILLTPSPFAAMRSAPTRHRLPGRCAWKCPAAVSASGQTRCRPA